MTVSDTIRLMDDNELGHYLCEAFFLATQNCKCCPAYKECSKRQNGMVVLLKEEFKEE